MNLSLVRKYIKNVNWSVSNCLGWRIWYQYSRLQGFYLMCLSLMLLEFTFILVVVSLYYLFEKHVLNLPSIPIELLSPSPHRPEKTPMPYVCSLSFFTSVACSHLVSCYSLMFAACVYLYICLIVHNSGNIYSSCLRGLVWSAGLHVSCIALNAYLICKQIWVLKEASVWKVWQRHESHRRLKSLLKWGHPLKPDLLMPSARWILTKENGIIGNCFIRWWSDFWFCSHAWFWGDDHFEVKYSGCYSSKHMDTVVRPFL